MASSKPRQANGRSSIYQAKADGRWHGRVTMGAKTDGSPDRRHVTGKTRAAVTRKVRLIEKQRDSGDYAAAGINLTVADWLSQWLEHIAAPTVAPKSLAAYRTAVHKHLIPGLGKHRLANLREHHIDKFYAHMGGTVTVGVDGTSRSTYRPATIAQVHRTLRTALGHAQRRGLVGRNPAIYAALPASKRIEDDELATTPLTLDQARAVTATAHDVRNGLRYVVAIALGLRQGEALGLMWGDLDLDVPVPLLHVRRQLQRNTWQHGCNPEKTPSCGAKRPAACPKRHSGGLVLSKTKSSAGRRTIALPQPVVEDLRRHAATQAADRLTAGTEWNEHGLVFTQANGRPIDPRADLRGWKDLLEKAQVPEFRLHDARHTAATLLLAQGIDARVAMDVMGWSTIHMLQRYQHVADDLRAEAARRVGESLFQ